MLIPYYEANDEDTGHYVRGFYFEYPQTTYCFSEDYQKFPVKLIPCIVSYHMVDWGLPNQPTLCSPIDKSTLKQIGWIDTNNNTYCPETYLQNITEIKKYDDLLAEEDDLK